MHNGALGKKAGLDVNQQLKNPGQMAGIGMY